VTVFARACGRSCVRARTCRVFAVLDHQLPGIGRARPLCAHISGGMKGRAVVGDDAAAQYLVRAAIGAAHDAAMHAPIVTVGIYGRSYAPPAARVDWKWNS
jgi:hypothetical protein